MLSLQTFQLSILQLKTFLFRMGEFQPFEFFFFAREIELFLCNCEIKMHEFSSSFTVLFFITEKARYKFLIMFLIIIVIITIIIITGLQCNCAIFVLILFLFLSFSFSVIAWSSKFIGIRFLEKKNREGHKN